MGPTVVRLDTALTGIVDHVHARCLAATAADGLLEDLTDVVKGNRDRARPDPPYLWVTIGAATCTQARALHESWEAALLLNAFVASEDPQDAWLEAVEFAARARSVVLQDRTLGPSLPYVEDTQSAEVGVLGQFAQGRRFGAYARINVRFSIVEPEEAPA